MEYSLSSIQPTVVATDWQNGRSIVYHQYNPPSSLSTDIVALATMKGVYIIQPTFHRRFRPTEWREYGYSIMTIASIMNVQRTPSLIPSSCHWSIPRVCKNTTVVGYMHENSEELGRLFVKNSSHGKTNYECRVTKFGIDKVFQAIEECVCVSLWTQDVEIVV